MSNRPRPRRHDLHHHVVGEITLTTTAWNSPPTLGQALTVWTAEPRSKSAEALSPLGSWARRLNSQSYTTSQAIRSSPQALPRATRALERPASRRRPAAWADAAAGCRRDTLACSTKPLQMSSIAICLPSDARPCRRSSRLRGLPVPTGVVRGSPADPRAGSPRDERSRRSFAPGLATTVAICRTFTGATGLEPATSGVTGRSWRFRAERG